MPSGRSGTAQRGFTYLALLIAVALIGIGLVAASEVWSQSRQREKERELLFIGEQFRRAIGMYYERTPGGARRYPEKLQDLLEDDRYAVKQRYLRKMFVDPMTGKADWGVVMAPGGGIMGVFSRSDERPIKTANFSEQNRKFERARRYSQWRFIYEPAMNPFLKPQATQSPQAMQGEQPSPGVPAPQAAQAPAAPQPSQGPTSVR